MTRRIPPFPAVRAFEAAARQSSFKQAAEELHVTPSAISHQVKALEQYLGVALFRRKPQGVDLTDALTAKYGEGCPGCAKLVCTCDQKP